MSKITVASSVGSAILALASFAFADGLDGANAVPSHDVSFLTGDSWEQDGQIVRLFGVQACLRNTFYTDHAGQKQDCGSVAASMLAALIRDTRPTCKTVARIMTSAASNATLLAVCSADVGGARLDLGGVLIHQGFAFAALEQNGRPVYPPYFLAETVAANSAKGLWSYPDLPHPNIALRPGAEKQ